MLRFKLHHLFAVSLLVTGLCQCPARAMGISFELANQTTNSLAASNPDKNPLTPIPLKSDIPPSRTNFSPLPVPARASQPPIRASHTRQPNNVIAASRVLTPPPSEALPTPRILTPANASPPPQSIALSFVPAASVESSSDSPATSQSTTPPNWLYEGGSDSLVARVIGSAEGTRTASGNPTRAYYGHTDPGNGVWNMGTFSYQHGAKSPQEADKKQLLRLKRQGKTIANQADQANLTMTLGELLNGLDLANQSPGAALERGGYVDRLTQAREKGMRHDEAIVWARTYSYLNPDTQRWNAPGLGNTLHSIQRDQDRRHDAVAQAFHYYQAQRKIDIPAAKILAEPPIASAQPPLAAVAQSENVPVETVVSKSQTSRVTRPIPAIPLKFEVADSFEPAPEIIQHKDTSTVVAPHTEAELSLMTTDKFPNEKSSQSKTPPEPISSQISS